MIASFEDGDTERLACGMRVARFANIEAVARRKLRQQIDYVESPEVVSTDFVGSHRAGIVDGLATIANDQDVVLYVWYDNEYGYSCQVIRVLEVMAGSHPVVLPARREVTLHG